MKHFVVTIGREFGCNAREIGRQLAAKLGVKFYDRELVELAAQKAGVDDEVFGSADEQPGVLQNFFTEFGYGSTRAFYSGKAIEAQAYVIRKIANSESCVMLGRCADYFLQEFGTTLNAFVYAPLSYRIAHVSEAYGLTTEESEKMIKKIDRRRHKYYKFVTGHNRGDRHGRNLMLDVEMFGVEGTVNLIHSAVLERFGG
ncbi:AAA family ATPase [uncultured Treponema sp.]|uniref:cytidylate kinase-like family protein n=1 Tax=uncultured Treponema sp. TaxID=162155 RepID=UPI0015B87C9F|nr:cytidylate kinase-like family protein [uncultured Treponema sp.]